MLFVAVGSALGGEASYWTGRRADRLLKGRWDPSSWRGYRRAEQLFLRYGGLALVIGRFLGPVAGLAPLVAAVAGMKRRRFHLWNSASAVPYAVAHVSMGYAAGDVLGRIGPQLTRFALLAAALVAILVLIWFIARQIRRGLPVLLAGLAGLRDMTLEWPPVARWVSAHPRASGFIAARFATDRFSGLTSTVLALVLLYLTVVWADTALDFLLVPGVAETDVRLARLLHAFWSPTALRFFGLVTGLGYWPVVLAVFLGAVGALAITRRTASLAQLVAALAGDLITVSLLKGSFARQRPNLSYFVETSGSFPSGHATLSVAFWGTLFVILWREKVLGPTTALVSGAILAFLIGFSRLYLVEHFLSDVVNGWLLGGMWLVIGLALSEAMRENRPERPATGLKRQMAAGTVTVVALALAGWQIAVARPPRAEAIAVTEPARIDAAASLGTAALPLEAQSLDGEQALPVTLVFIAPDLATVEDNLTKAGWRAVDRPTPGAIIHAAWSDWTGASYPTAPLTPMFWRSDPQQAGWRNADASIELRLWKASARSRNGSTLVIGVLAPTSETGAPWEPSPATTALLSAMGDPQATGVAGASATTGTAPNDRKWSWDGKVWVVKLGLAKS